MLNVAFGYKITPSVTTGMAPYSTDDWIKLPIGRILSENTVGVVSNLIEQCKNPIHARMRFVKINAKHRVIDTTLRKYLKHLQVELKQSVLDFEDERKGLRSIQSFSNNI